MRWQEEGTLEFLGRNDRQTKIRGHRIELDEVESVLSEHPGVEAAAVIVSEHAERGDELVAYVRPRPTGDRDRPGPGQAAELRRDLRRFLGDRLGAAMTPSQVVVIDELPLLPNGKTDRARLPAPEAVGSVPGDPDPSDGPPAESGAQALVRTVWGAVLGTDRIDARSDFFELGGTSLTAVAMAARWVAAGGPPFDLELFLKRPTVRHLVEIAAGRCQAPAAEWAATGPLDPRELARLAVLPPDIGPAGPVGAPAAVGRTVLVTAAGEALGAHLVRELLDRPGIRVYGLVTSADAEEAARRLHDSLSSLGLRRDGDTSRLIAVAGDPSRPYLGTEPATYRRLQDEVDLIIHPGECFDRRSTWEQLSAANILGTQEVLRLASSGDAKPVHFLSPLDLAAAPVPGEQHGDLVGADEAAGALRQSKWVAERQLRQAAARGIPTVTHRFGQVAGTRQQTVHLHDAFLSALIRTCISLRSAPDLDLSFPVTPLTLLAREVVDSALERGGAPVTAVAGRPVSWQEIVSDIRFSGRAVEVVPYGRWRQLLLETVERAEIHALTPFLPLVGADGLSPALGYRTDRADRALPQPEAGSGGGGTGEAGGRDLLRTYPSRFDAVNATAGGIVVREHTVTVPLDHAQPQGATISVYAQEVVSAERQQEDLPWLLFLQGGPGAPCPTPTGSAGWLGAALEGHRVLLLDQRGGGRSAPITAGSMAGRSASEMAAHLRHFRADSIVEDAEILRKKIAGGRPWSLLGQSYGGFIALTYLSTAPEGLTSVFVSGGLPGLTESVDEVYARAYTELLRKNAGYYAEYPEDAGKIRRLADHLEKNDVRLPDGDRLTSRRLRFLGRNLGMSFGFERLHQLFEQAWDGDEVSEVFRRAVGPRRVTRTCSSTPCRNSSTPAAG